MLFTAHLFLCQNCFCDTVGTVPIVSWATFLLDLSLA